MIQKQQCYVIGEKIFVTFEQAQRHELSSLLREIMLEENRAEKAATWMLERKDKFLDLLTMSPRSRAKARAIHGGTKKRKIVAANPSAVNAMLQDIKQ